MFYPLSLFNRNRRAPAVREQAGASPFFRLQREMNRLFDETFSDFGLPAAFGGAFSGDGAPNIDVRETDTTYEIAAELPGVAEDDIDVELAENVITLRGEKRFERDHEDAKGGFHVMERSYGSFARSIPLPFDVDHEAIEAVFRDGVLRLTVPKPAEIIDKTKKILVRRA